MEKCNSGKIRGKHGTSREMRRLMEDKKLREVLGSNARNLVEEYSWENSVKKLDSVYSLRVS